MDGKNITEPNRTVTEPKRYLDGKKSNLFELVLTSEEGMVEYLAHYPPLGDSDHEVHEVLNRKTHILTLKQQENLTMPPHH